MRSGALDATLDRSSALRLLAAAALSAAFHAGVIVVVRAGVPAPPPHPPAALIEARIEASTELPLGEAPALLADRAEPSASIAAMTASPVAATRSENAPAAMPQAESAKAAGRASADGPVPDRRSAPPAHHAPMAESMPAARSNEAQSAAPQVHFAPDTTYYPIAALDRLPAPLSAPDVCYPSGATGEVTYELLIDETGAVNQAALVSGSPAGLATAAAVELCRAIRFSPARKGGRDVRSRVRLVVGFGTGS